MEYIWNFLLSFIKNEYGVAGLMGNLQAESNFNPRNLEGKYEKTLGFTDDSYTEAVDGGNYNNFVHDAAGYGLAQWTYWTRKQALLDFARERGTSIGDLDTQLEFLRKELNEYSGVLKVLQAATSVKEASDKVMISYEKPANQSEAEKTKRANYGQTYYDKFSKEKKIMATKVIIGSARIDENGNAYNGKAGDQTGKEVSTQNWYKHTKGWRVFRAKDPQKALKIAAAMKAACDNPHIGYDQWERLTLYNEAKKYDFDVSKVTKNVETDCSALVRVCCAYAGIMLANFTTDKEPKILLDSGEFVELTDKKYTESQDYLRAGDILDTATKGHTVVVLTDGDFAYDENALRKGMKGDAVKALQEILIQEGYELPKYGVDGDFGTETENALKAWQRDHGLPETGVYTSEVAPTPPEPKPQQTFRATLFHLTIEQVEKLGEQWPMAVIEVE